jgi:hypothetical protein
MSDDPNMPPGTVAVVVTSQIMKELQERNLLPPAVLQAIPNPDSLPHLINTLKSKFSPTAVVAEGQGQDTWARVGLVYRELGRHYEALSIFRNLYYHMLTAQQETSA